MSEAGERQRAEARRARRRASARRRITALSSSHDQAEAPVSEEDMLMRPSPGIGH